jgi:hypothetical protein
VWYNYKEQEKTELEIKGKLTQYITKDEQK